MRLRAALRRPLTWIVALAVLVLLVAVVAPFVYINLIRGDPPERLMLPDRAPAATTAPAEPEGAAAPGDAPDTVGTTTPTAPAAADLEGSWTVSEGIAGYRAREVLFGQDAEAVGRTSDVGGALEVDGTTVTAADFVVDMTTIESDESRRDNQFHGRIMDTATYPTATFSLTTPIALAAPPADDEELTVDVTGDFTIRGVTRPVTFPLVARRTGPLFEVNGTIPVLFADYGIPDASFGPAVVRDHGEIELLLTFVRE